MSETNFRHSMSIYARPGSKVRFHNEGGYDFEQEDAAKLLTLEAIYTVAWTEVHSDHTNVYLEECPGKKFNSCQFEDAAVKS